MATFHALLTLSDSAQRELSPGINHSGLDVTVQNVDEAANLFIGGTGVTAADYGFKLVPGAGVSFELNPRDQLFIISDVDGSKAALIRIFLEDV
jgi:hypothetical protein